MEVTLEVLFKCELSDHDGNCSGNDCEYDCEEYDKSFSRKFTKKQINNSFLLIDSVNQPPQRS